MWCYGEKSAVPSDLPPNYRIHEGVPEDFGSANGEPSLVILDDLLTDVYSKQEFELFTRGSNQPEFKRYSNHSISVSSGQVL